MNDRVCCKNNDYRGCEIRDILVIVLIYRVVLFKKTVSVSELPSIKEVAYVWLLHNAWPVCRLWYYIEGWGVKIFKKMKSFKVRWQGNHLEKTGP